MGVLDRLENEARASRKRREDEAASRTREMQASLARLDPAIGRARTYFETLARHLNEIDRPVTCDYDLDGVGVLSALEQERYRVAVADDGHGVRFSFDCTGRLPVEVSVPGHAKAQAIARELRSCGLSCRATPRSDRVMDLKVEPKVTPRASFKPDLERGQIELELRNLPAVGLHRYPLAPERVDEALLDAIANLVLREPSALADLTDSVVDAERRAALARQLGRDRRQREAEIAGGARRLFFPVVEWFRRLGGG